MEVENESSSSKVIPDRLMEGVRRTLADINELQSNFDQFLSLSSDPDVLNELPPLDRAHTLLMLAKASSLLLSVRLRCSGVYPDHHPVKGELERLRGYEEKLNYSMQLSKEPLRPKTTLNSQAAARFIEHSLPDLTQEQRQSMRAIGNNVEGKRKYSEKNVPRKKNYQSSDAKSVREAAQEFLEKAARELLGENNGGVKGPLAPVQAVDLEED